MAFRFGIIFDWVPFMRWLSLFSIVLFFSCSGWKHTVYPKYGYAFKPTDVVLIRNTDLNRAYDQWLTEKVFASYHDCQAEFINYVEVMDKLHKHLLDLEKYDEPDSSILYRIRKAVNADYYLTGGFSDRSASSGAGIYQMTEWEKTYNPSSLDRWKKCEFVLYNLKTGERVFTTRLTWTRSYSDDGDHRIYLPSIGVYNKMVKKLRNSCGCE